MRAQDGIVRLVPADAYDALIFTESIARVRTSPRAAERFQALGGGS
jgi:hypothetical protein